MRAEPECIPCILKDIEEAGRIVLKDREKVTLLLKRSMEFLSKEFDGKNPPPYYITEVHRILKEISGLEIPFEERRMRCTEIGLQISKRIDKETRKLDGFERFAQLALWAVAGNSIDFRTVGSGYDSDLSKIEGKWREVFSQGLAVDERRKVWEALQRSKRVLYIPDNVGELALDHLLMKFMKERVGAYGDTPLLVVGMRDGAITSDATMEDAKTMGLDRIVDHLILTGPDTLGIPLPPLLKGDKGGFTEMSKDLREELHLSDLVIAKGQANYQVLSALKESPQFRAPHSASPMALSATLRIPKCACLFTTKCNLVSSRFGLEGKVGIVKMI